MGVPDLHLLIVGGSLDHPGGVEAFCDRSTIALGNHGGWRVSRLTANTAYLRTSQLPRLARGLAALARYRFEKLDCVWVQYGNLPDLAFVLVAKALGMRVMVTPHLGSAWRSQTNRMLRALSGSVLRAADRLALISRTQEEEINLSPSVPRSLIRNFLPEDVLTVALPDKEATPPTLQLIHSGRLSEGKGSFMVVELCARLRDKGVPFYARITGGADEETYGRLRDMIAEHGLEDQVALLGRVPEDELLDHLRSADLLIHLSRIDSYPLITLEALACSTMPVCLELAGARDQIETYGGHVVGQPQPVEDAASWLAALDVVKLRREGRAASARVRADYAWPRCAAALDAALRACVADDRQVFTQPDAVR